MKTETKTQVATFGAGCFWGVEETFRQIPGVVSTAVGYAGGTTVDPTYEQVCTDLTGHAEVVQVTFDPSIVPYKKLLEVFFDSHNPTTLNYQGPDFGTQYRSVIFFENDDQRRDAEDAVRTASASGKWGGKPVVTQVVPKAPFYRAEDYHQKYLSKRGLGSCHI
jgi:peptide-methionine (S)-S-oxide reductase